MYIILYIAASESVSEKEVFKGEDVTINCPASGNMQWYYREDLDDDPQAATVVFQDTTVLNDDLTINGVAPSHEGYFHCTVDGTPQAPTLLIVLGELV